MEKDHFFFPREKLLLENGKNIICKAKEKYNIRMEKFTMETLRTSKNMDKDIFFSMTAASM